MQLLNLHLLSPPIYSLKAGDCGPCARCDGANLPQIMTVRDELAWREPFLFAREPHYTAANLPRSSDSVV